MVDFMPAHLGTRSYLAWLSSAPAEQALRADPDISAALGRGINSIGLKDRGDAIERINLIPRNIGSNETELRYFDTYHSLYDFLSIDVQASFNAFAGHGSVEVSFVRTTQISQYSVVLLLRKKVETYEYRLVQPRLIDSGREDSAWQALSRSPAEFRKTYGDEFVDRVTYGGALYVLIEIVTQSAAEAQSMRIAASGASGPVSASTEVQRKLNSVTNENRLSSRTFSVGIEGEIPLQRPVAQESFYQYLDRLFQYFNTFNEKLKNDGLGSELAYNRVDYNAVGNRPRDALDFRAQKTFVRDCIIVRDEITRRKDAIKYAIANPTLYQDGEVNAFRETERQLERDGEQLERYVEELFSSPADVNAGPPITIDRLPNLPTPVPVIDIPVQITLHTADWHHHLTASGAKGTMIRIPLPTNANEISILSLYKIDLQLVTYDLDLHLIIQARMYPPGGVQWGGARWLPVTSEAEGTIGSVGLGAAGLMDGTFLVGLSFRLEGRDKSAYTIIYRGLTYDLETITRSGGRNLPPPALTPYASDGGPIGDMNAPPLEPFKAPNGPYFVGLEINLVPRAGL
jgi:hypothetical protein